jgi:hypothetical protein
MPNEAPEVIDDYRMNAGPFEGEDPHDLIEQAIKWWENYLDAVERDANATP